MSPHLDETQRSALLGTANSLKQAAEHGALQRLLHGKNIALISEQLSAADAGLFEHAATGIGARVSRIQAKEAGLLAGNDLLATAKMLGKLYDAIECLGLDPAVHKQLEALTGIPVLDCTEYATDEAAEDSSREAIIQSILLSSLR